MDKQHFCHLVATSF